MKHVLELVSSIWVVSGRSAVVVPRWTIPGNFGEGSAEYWAVKIAAFVQKFSHFLLMVRRKCERSCIFRKVFSEQSE